MLPPTPPSESVPASLRTCAPLELVPANDPVLVDIHQLYHLLDGCVVAWDLRSLHACAWAWGGHVLRGGRKRGRALGGCITEWGLRSLYVRMCCMRMRKQNEARFRLRKKEGWGSRGRALMFCVPRCCCASLCQAALLLCPSKHHAGPRWTVCNMSLAFLSCTAAVPRAFACSMQHPAGPLR